MAAETARGVVRPAAGGESYKYHSFGSGETGSPFMVSGELFLRSTQSLLFSSGGGDPVEPSPSQHHRGGSTDPAAASSHQHRHPSAALLTGLSPDLRDLLLCHPDVNATGLSAGVGDGDGLRGLVSSARAERRAVRRKRVEYLKNTKAIAGCLSTARLSAVRRAREGFREGCAQGRAQLDVRLRALVLRFASAVSAEIAAEDAQTAAEGRHCRREMERLELAARLASLAATAEHRMRGSVVLRRLPPTHPQHARCLRAATENVKPGFFSSKSPYGAVQVLDIYKIENRVLLENFQRAAEATGPCKVKGLFCRVPDESLEHVVLYGMGGVGALTDDGGGGNGRGGGAGSLPAAAAWGGALINFLGEGGAANLSARREEGRAGERDVGGGGGGSSKRPLEFPRAFSRHSTLEEEHGYANSSRGCDDDGAEGGVRRHRRPCSSPPAGGTGARNASPQPVDSRSPWRRQRASGEGAATEGQQRGVAVSGLRFLALCRVMIGSMHVATVPSPEAAAERKGSGGGGGGGGGTSCHGSCSPPDRTNSPATKRLPEGSSASSSPPSSSSAPGVQQFTLPPPPPGQAEFDSVYFPREEEYRLLNEAFVLPEFLVVHRFVAAPAPAPVPVPAPSAHAAHHGMGGAPAASVGGGAAACGNEGGEGRQQQQQPAAGDRVSPGNREGGAGAERTAENRGEREKQQPQHHRNGRTQKKFAPPVLASAASQDAASVVAEIEAAMGRIVLSRGDTDLPHSGGAGGGCGGDGNPLPCEAAAPLFYGKGDSASSLSGDFGPANGGSDGGGLGEGRGRRRGSGRAVRDSIVNDVVLEFERCWQEMERLREVEKSGTAKTALSRRKLRQPP